MTTETLTSPHRAADPAVEGPVRWKQFLMTASVIWCLQTTVSTAVRPLVADWPSMLRSGVTIIPVVALMTWIVMPRLTRRLSGWLHRGR